ncbi:hypothetical protein JCM6882_000207 [Rhodosporidiobolus microsporus]
MPPISPQQELLPRSLLISLHACYDHLPPLYFSEFEHVYQQITNREKRLRNLGRELEATNEKPPRGTGWKGVLKRATGFAAEQRFTRRYERLHRRVWSWAVLPLLRFDYLKAHLHLEDELHTLLQQRADPPGARELLQKLPHFLLRPEQVEYFHKQGFSLPPPPPDLPPTYIPPLPPSVYHCSCLQSAAFYAEPYSYDKRAKVVKREVGKRSGKEEEWLCRSLWVEETIPGLEGRSRRREGGRE